MASTDNATLFLHLCGHWTCML